MTGNNNNKDQDEDVNVKDSIRTTNNNRTSTVVVASRVDLEDLGSITEIRRRSRY